MKTIKRGEEKGEGERKMWSGMNKTFPARREEDFEKEREHANNKEKEVLNLLRSPKRKLLLRAAVIQSGVARWWRWTLGSQ